MSAGPNMVAAVFSARNLLMEDRSVMADRYHCDIVPDSELQELRNNENMLWIISRFMVIGRDERPKLSFGFEHLHFDGETACQVSITLDGDYIAYFTATGDKEDLSSHIANQVLSWFEANSLDGYATSDNGCVVIWGPTAWADKELSYSATCPGNNSYFTISDSLEFSCDYEIGELKHRGNFSALKNATDRLFEMSGSHPCCGNTYVYKLPLDTCGCCDLVETRANLPVPFALLTLESSAQYDYGVIGTSGSYNPNCNGDYTWVFNLIDSNGDIEYTESGDQDAQLGTLLGVSEMGVSATGDFVATLTVTDCDGNIAYSRLPLTISVPPPSPPVLQSIIIEDASPSRIVLTTDISLDPASVPLSPFSEFTLNLGKTVTAVSISGNTVNIDVDTAYAYLDAATLEYAAGVNPIRGLADMLNLADITSPYSITNNITNPGNTAVRIGPLSAMSETLISGYYSYTAISPPTPWYSYGLGLYKIPSGTTGSAIIKVTNSTNSFLFGLTEDNTSPAASPFADWKYGVGMFSSSVILRQNGASVSPDVPSSPSTGNFIRIERNGSTGVTKVYTGSNSSGPWTEIHEFTVTNTNELFIWGCARDDSHGFGDMQGDGSVTTI